MPTNKDLWKVGGSDVIAAYMGNTQVYAAFNDATGGTVTEIDDYNGAIGETWRIHTFTEGNHTFDITRSQQPFRVLLVGRGGYGGNIGGCDGDGNGSGGGGGEFLADDAMTITTGQHAIDIAGNAQAFGLTAVAGGNGGGCYGKGANGASGGGGGTGSGPMDMRVGGSATVAGQGRGSDGHQYYPGQGGGAGGSASGSDGGVPGWGKVTNIRGSDEYMAAGGHGSKASTSRPSVYGRGGGKGCHGCGMYNPQSGAVIIAYQIGGPIATQINQPRQRRTAPTEPIPQHHLVPYDIYDDGTPVNP